MKLAEKNAASAFDHFMKVLDDFWLPRSAGKRRPQLASCVARARAHAWKKDQWQMSSRRRQLFSEARRRGNRPPMSLGKLTTPRPGQTKRNALAFRPPVVFPCSSQCFYDYFIFFKPTPSFRLHFGSYFVAPFFYSCFSEHSPNSSSRGRRILRPVELAAIAAPK